MRTAAHPGLDDAQLHRLPMFPLPDLALFPGASAPLQLFEPRYVAMAEHCIRGPGERTVALACLQPNPEADYCGRPDVLPIMGAGCITADRRLPDGRWLITVVGACRVRLVEEWPADTPFRMIRAERVSDISSPKDVQLASQVGRLAHEVTLLAQSGGEEARMMLQRCKTPSALADLATALLVCEPGLRIALMHELNVERRLKLLAVVLSTTLLEVGCNTDALPV